MPAFSHSLFNWTRAFTLSGARGCQAAAEGVEDIERFDERWYTLGPHPSLFPNFCRGSHLHDLDDLPQLD
jgi:hypothetical protein